MPSLPTIFLILAALSSGAAVIAVIVTIRANRESQSAIFPIVKEEEALKARRARISIVVWLAITALLLGGWLAALQFTPADAVTTTEVESPAATATPLPPEPVEVTPPAEILPLETTSEPALLPTNTPNFTATPPESTATPTPTAIPPTDTPVPTPTPAATNTASPEPTATPTITATPTATTPPVVRAETSERNPAPAGVRVGPIKFGADINDNFEPIDPGKLFPANTAKVYAAFPFRGMADGLNFTAVWYKNGVEFSRDEVEWPYGAVGASYRFITLRGEGLYKLELLVNDTVAATSLFELR